MGEYIQGMFPTIINKNYQYMRLIPEGSSLDEIQRTLIRLNLEAHALRSEACISSGINL